MGKIAKSTKKFQKNKLQGELDKRKASKQARKWVDKKHGRHAAKESRGGDDGDEDADKESGAPAKERGVVDLEAMNWREIDSRKFREMEEDLLLDDLDLKDFGSSSSSESESEQPKQKLQKPQSAKAAASGSEDEMSVLDSDDVAVSADEEDNEENDDDISDDDVISDEEEDSASVQDVGDEEDEEDEGDEEEDYIASSEDEDDGAPRAARPKLTMEMLHAWETSVKQHESNKAFRSLLQAFRSTTEFFAPNAKAATAKGAKEGVAADAEGESRAAYRIESNKVVLETIRLTLSTSRHILETRFAGAAAGDKVAAPLTAQASAWERHKDAFRALATNVTHFLNALRHGATVNEEVAVLVLGQLLPLMPAIVPFERQRKAIVKELLAFWSTVGYAGADAEGSSSGSGKNPLAVSDSAFAVLAGTMALRDEPSSSLILKGAYLSFVTFARRQTTSHGIAAVEHLLRGVAALYASDAEGAYLHAYVYIRMLAVQLRSAMRDQTRNTAMRESSGKDGKKPKGENEAVRGAQSWAVVWSVRVWASVLSVVGKEVSASAEVELLRGLIYPFVQIVLGLLRLHTTTATLPFRLHLLEALVNLGALTHTYVPLYSNFHVIFSSLLFSASPKATMEKTVDVDVVLRLPVALLGTRAAFDSVCATVQYLFAAWLAPWWSNLGFPELCAPVTVHLRRAMKTSKNVRACRMFKELVDRLERTSELCARERARIAFTPAELDKCRQWEREGWGKNQATEHVPIVGLLLNYKRDRDFQRKTLKEGHAEGGKGKRAGADKQPGHKKRRMPDGAAGDAKKTKVRKMPQKKKQKRAV